MSHETTSIERFGPVSHVLEAVRRGVGTAGAVKPANRMEDRLLELGDQHRRLWIANSRAASRVEVFDSLLRRSEKTRHFDAAESLEISRVALRISESLRGAPGVSSGALSARAWISLAHAERVSYDFEASAEALGRAEQDLGDCAGGEPVLVASLLNARASLQRATDSPEEALRTGREACRIFAEHGLADRVLFMRVFETGCLSLLDQPRKALELGVDTLRCMGTGTSPSLLAYAVQGVGIQLANLGSLEPCVQVMRTLLPFAERHDLRRLALSIRGMEGLCLSLLGCHTSAVGILGPLLPKIRRLAPTFYFDELSDSYRRSSAMLGRTRFPAVRRVAT